MTIPHRQERAATSGESGAGEPREPGTRQPGPVSYDDAARRYGPGTIGARERYDELSMRDHLARAYARLRASGEYDAARHGTPDTDPLTAAEHLDMRHTTHVFHVSGVAARLAGQDASQVAVSRPPLGLPRPARSR